MKGCIYLQGSAVTQLAHTCSMDEMLCSSTVLKEIDSLTKYSVEWGINAVHFGSKVQYMNTVMNVSEAKRQAVHQPRQSTEA
jgi:hypothetical protein